MAWRLAELDDKQLAIVNEAEASMHMDYLLVYAQAEDEPSFDLGEPLRPAPLSESEVECLRGMEKNLGVIAVAYERAARLRPATISSGD